MSASDGESGSIGAAAAQDEVTRLLHRVATGDDHAGAVLIPLIYERLRAIAGSHLRGRAPDGTLQATALVHEAYLKLVKPNAPCERVSARWNDRAHFFAVASSAMRQLLADHARRRRAAKRGGARAHLTLTGITVGSRESVIDAIALDDALQSLSRIDERQAQIVAMRFFGGLTHEEIGHVLDVSTRTIEKEWRKARAWLSVALSGERRS